MAASITFSSLRLLSTSSRLILRNNIIRCLSSTQSGSQLTTDAATERDPFPIFSDKKVQDLLFRITGYDYLKVAGPQKKKISPAVYKLLTDEEMQKDIDEAKERLKFRVQIPPFMNPRKRHLTPLIVDPDLAGFDTSSYVFVDVSFGLKDRQRSVLMRETNGDLRVAPWDVKERMNGIFNPRVGREYMKPKMFEEQFLEKLIVQKKYLYILDRACCQFEPDDPDFIRTTRRVYNAINSMQDFDLLRSTRHFGSLAFYLAWNASIDDLLLDMINRDLLSDAGDLINLYCLIHPSSSCTQELSNVSGKDPDVCIQAYLKTDSKKKSQHELSLQAILDARKAKQKLKTQTN
ncbi:28S ribosomal protein S22, mitochondrial-like [Biomphalaria glabrata]|uniref:28S ribosomal protein S22, mitochondrial-like n=1 Tax=Biomphalaria glabrata TaxID=6526 RepID=A0A9U8DX98_BIOGL|nr:28S ribosomal protein S22, mitochondrial-like [Biomphalaria glabrata]